MPVPVRLVSFLGALGTLFCVVGGLGVWYVELRMDRAREQLFERADQSLSRIDRRLVDVQRLVAESKITVEEVRLRVQDWTKNEAGDRLAAEFDIEARVQRLVAGLRQAELMVELSDDTVQQVRQILELGVGLGLSITADSVDPLLKRLSEFKEELSRAIEIAESFGERIGDNRSDETQARRMEQIATVSVRLMATFGKVDSRLISFRDRLVDTRDAIGKVNARTRSRLIALAVCATLFLVWMGAGQVCLWRWALNLNSVLRLACDLEFCRVYASRKSARPGAT